MMLPCRSDAVGNTKSNVVITLVRADESARSVIHEQAHGAHEHDGKVAHGVFKEPRPPA